MYVLKRIDDNGNEYVMQEFPDFIEAEKMRILFEEKGHKQLYFVQPKTKDCKMSELRVFSASWCGPCKALKPVLNELKEEGHNIVFVDVDENSEMAQKYGIRGVPTMLKFEGDEVKGTLVGVKSKEEILKLINDDN